MGGTSLEAVLALLPQTQCRRCGYDDCRGYAEAIAEMGEQINRCPPGGAEGIGRLSALTGRPVAHLDASCGAETPRALAVIDEAWCIGCALCLKACPVDAIVGAAKRMHVVVDVLCTGCELCLPVCPVDCIAMVAVEGGRTGWQAWDAALAGQARARYARHAGRLRSAADATAAAAAPSSARRETIGAVLARVRASAGTVTAAAADADRSDAS